MDIFNNLYILSVKNKHLIPTALLFLIGLIMKKEKVADQKDNISYLGDSVPLNLVERIKDIQYKSR